MTVTVMSFLPLRVAASFNQSLEPTRMSALGLSLKIRVGLDHWVRVAQLDRSASVTRSEDFQSSTAVN